MDLENLPDNYIIEPSDEHLFTEEYKKLLGGLVQFTANCELMGAFYESPWVPKAPTTFRKLALTAKLQDEVGHGLMQYQLVEDLIEEKERDQMIEDFVEGRVGFGNAFQYPVDSWMELGVFMCLIDGAAMILQHSLLSTNYGPYRRVMKRICREEEFHRRHGRDLVRDFLTGSRAEQEALEERINEWFPRALMFFGHPDNESETAQRMIELGIRTKSNDELRQDYLDEFVPLIRDKWGIEIRDDKLKYDEEAGKWRYTEPNWSEFQVVVKEGGPKAQERIGGRRQDFHETEWVRDALSAHNDAATGLGTNGGAIATDGGFGL